MAGGDAGEGDASSCWTSSAEALCTRRKQRYTCDSWRTPCHTDDHDDNDDDEDIEDDDGGDETKFDNDNDEM